MIAIKRLLALAAVCAVLLLPGAVSAESDVKKSGSCGDNLTWVLYDDDTLVISGTGDMDDYFNYSAPWYTDGSPKLPSGMKIVISLERVIIEEGVTSVGSYAFYDCDSNHTPTDSKPLTSVSLPSSVTSIGECAFYDCDSLESIAFPEKLDYIGEDAFCSCDALTEVEIPSSVTQIMDGAFADCSSLSQINVSSGNGFYSSDNGILFDKSKVNLIQYPAGKTDEEYSIPAGTRAIGEAAFKNCSCLTSVGFPSGLIEIGNEAFYNCTALTSVSIPEGAETIGSQAFYGASGLTEVRIASSVTEIGSSAFALCKAITDVYYSASEDDWAAIDIGSGNSYLLAASIHCEGATISSDTLDSGSCGENLTWTLSKDGVLTISGTGDMSNSHYTLQNGYLQSGSFGWDAMNPMIKKIIIEDGVTSIGDMAFDYMDYFTEISLPDSVKSIGYKSFAYCDALKTVTLGSGVESIDKWAFAYCEALESINLPYGLTSIGDSSFTHTALKAIELPGSLLQLGSDAFNSCDDLTEITISGNIFEILSGTFGYCHSLQTVILLDGVTEISAKAFAYSSSLKSVVIPKSVTSIGDDAFSYCLALSDIYYTGSRADWNKISIGECSDEVVGTVGGINEYGEAYSYNITADSLSHATITYNYGSDLSSPIHVTLNSAALAFDQPPVIIGGRTMVPLRAIFEALGANVGWDEESQTVTAEKNETVVIMTIGNNTMYVNGREILLDASPQLINSRTAVPVRAVAEAFGCSVDWDEDSRTVVITSL